MPFWEAPPGDWARPLAAMAARALDLMGPGAIRALPGAVSVSGGMRVLPEVVWALPEAVPAQSEAMRALPVVMLVLPEAVLALMLVAGALRPWEAPGQ